MSARGIKAPTLANKLHITRQAVYKWIKGVSSDLDAKTLLGLCSHLGLRPEWLLLGDGPMFQSPILADDEKDLILLYRDLVPEDRKRLQQIAATFVGETTRPPSAHRPFGSHRR